MRKARKPTLSPRQTQMLTWSARGMTSDEIARAMGLTKRSVDFSLDTARLKLGALTRVQAVAMAVQEKLIKP
ncbi:MAG TPA: helix-turn-helix transcriptional regulator [Burkholderiaceae bacterium]|nr:helix-turn-helix transcriptional regulator [Burkholderiaceae bacterium]